MNAKQIVESLLSEISSEQTPHESPYKPETPVYFAVSVPSRLVDEIEDLALGFDLESDGGGQMIGGSNRDLFFSGSYANYTQLLNALKASAKYRKVEIDAEPMDTSEDA